jgi:hypothetical protein
MLIAGDSSGETSSGAATPDFFTRLLLWLLVGNAHLSFTFLKLSMNVSLLAPQYATRRERVSLNIAINYTSDSENRHKWLILWLC